MNIAEKYRETLMSNPEFAIIYEKEKAKLDLEFLLDELTEKIQMEYSHSELLKEVKSIKRKLSKV